VVAKVLVGEFIWRACVSLGRLDRPLLARVTASRAGLKSMVPGSLVTWQRLARLLVLL